MNMTGFVYIPSNQNTGLSSIFQRSDRQPAFASLTNGDVLTAVVAERDSQHVTLRTPDDFTFRVSADSVTGDEGDTLHFRVVKQDSSGLALKQIIQQEADVALIRGDAGIEDIQQNTKTLEQMTEEADLRAETHKEQQVKAAQAVARVRRSQAFLSGNAGRAAIAALSASGISLEKVSFSTLNTVMLQMERHPEMQSRRKAADSVAQALRDQGLPVTKHNKAVLERVLERVSGHLEDDAIANLLRGEREITPENIYAGRYSASKKDGGQEAKAPIEELIGKWDSPKELDAQIEKLFQWEKIENTDKNHDVAKYLMANDLPITKENVESVSLLKELDAVSQEALLAKAAAAISQGKDPAKVDLLALNNNEGAQTIVVPESVAEAALKTVQALPLITTNDIRAVIADNLPVTLQQLIKSALAQGDAKNPVVEPGQKEKSLIEFKRQLAEIQLKMTSQAALRLAHKQINIDTAPLQELVEHLRKLESETHASFLRAVGANDTPQEVARMDDIFRHVRAIHPLTANVHAAVHLQQVEFSLSGVHQAVLAARALEQYEATATIPNPRYGDSFAKVRGQFEGLLENLGIETSAENIRAAFILSKNQMDVEQAAINSVKEIDAKIESVTRGLHPMLAAQMLKEGLSPLDMHMDDMLSYIRKYEQVHGHSGGDKIAQHILEMDKAGTLDSKERAGMIAVYRMLNVIQKNGAAALGFALKQDSSMTLGNLMEAAKYFDKNKRGDAGLDVSVNDSYGQLEAVLRPPESIRASLQASKSITPEYNDLLADALTDKALPENLQNLMANPEMLDKPVEDLLRDELADAPSFKPDMSQAAQAVRILAQASPALVTFMQSNGIPVTPSTLRAVRNASRSDNALEDSLNKLMEETIGDVGENIGATDSADWTDALMDSSLDAFQRGERPREIMERLWFALNNSLPTPAVQETRGLIEMQYGHENEELEIPIMLNGKVSTLKLFVLNEQAVADGQARTYLSLSTASMGKVEGFFTIAEGRVQLQFAVTDPEARAHLEANSGQLAALLQEIGYEIEGLQFTSATDSSSNEESGATAINNTSPFKASDFEFVI